MRPNLGSSYTIPIVALTGRVGNLLNLHGASVEVEAVSIGIANNGLLDYGPVLKQGAVVGK